MADNEAENEAGNEAGIEPTEEGLVGLQSEPAPVTEEAMPEIGGDVPTDGEIRSLAEIGTEEEGMTQFYGTDEEHSGNESSSEFSETEKEERERKEQIMREYLEIIKEIEAQNRIVSEMKKKICEKCTKGCLTKCEEREIKSLRCCLEKENLKLQCLLKRAVTLQEEDPSEIWDDIPIATTFEEDNMPIGLSYNVMQSVCKKSFTDDDDDDICLNELNKKSKPCESSGGIDSKSDLERFLCCLLKKAKKRRPKLSNAVCPDDDDDIEDDYDRNLKNSGGTLLDLDENTLKRILCALQCQTPCSTSDRGASGIGGHHRNQSKKKGLSKVRKELTRSYSMQEKLVQDNVNLEGDRFKLQEELLNRDRMIECLQQKIQQMQCELQKLCREKEKIIKQSSKKANDLTPRTTERLKRFRECAKHLQSTIDGMQSSVEHMKLEMNSLKRERDRWEVQTRQDDIQPKKKSKSNEIEDLKRNYANLLADYCKKESELKEMQQRTKGFIDPTQKKHGGSNGSPDVDLIELQILREKITDLQEEQEEYKCLIKEQSSQVDDYRKKYLMAQQKCEELKCVIEKLEMNNKKVEDQINMEIQKIKNKFQEKLKELSHLPKLLENEQLKMSVVCKEKEDLEQKLRLVCKELKAIKAKLADAVGDGADEDLPEKLRKAEHELAAMKKHLEETKADKDLICDKLQRIQEDLDCLRTESARIIARTKERCENQRETLQHRIDVLEKELAQCRATASMSISDREEVIKEMKGQLCTLSYSFDSAQKQIKTLKNHIAFLSNENSYLVKS